MKIDRSIRDWLIQLNTNKRVRLEGNILKLLEADADDAEFQTYIKESTELDTDTRRKRLDVTRQVQDQNKELQSTQAEIRRVNQELQSALENAEAAKKAAEAAKDAALSDLDVIQKKSQFELIGTIVKTALGVIASVGVITTLMYALAMFTGKDTQIIGSTWSNMFGILLTNAFSIVGTIMGVKYASENKSHE